jgi:hypothetical protein
MGSLNFEELLGVLSSVERSGFKFSKVPLTFSTILLSSINLLGVMISSFGTSLIIYKVRYPPNHTEYYRNTDTAVTVSSKLTPLPLTCNFKMLLILSDALFVIPENGL